LIISQTKAVSPQNNQYIPLANKKQFQKTPTHIFAAIKNKNKKILKQ